MPADKKRNYLIFEATQPDINQTPMYTHGREVPRPANLYPYNCIGAVRAASEEEAIKAVMSVTRRIGKYAVIECEIVDFTIPVQEAEGSPYELNP